MEHVSDGLMVAVCSQYWYSGWSCDSVCVVPAGPCFYVVVVTTGGSTETLLSVAGVAIPPTTHLILFFHRGISRSVGGGGGHAPAYVCLGGV